MATWKIGSTTVTRIEEQLGVASVTVDRYLPGLDREVLARHMSWLVPNHYAPAADRLITSVHSWLIRTGRHTILLDACGGNHKSRPWAPRYHMLDTPWLGRLAAAGAAPEQIDIVMCTHLHADHVGWNTMLHDGRWVPTFPNARYLLSRREVAHWDAAQNPAMASDPRRGLYDDSVLPVMASGQAVLVDDGHAIDPELTVEAAPGHTPGHLAVALRSGQGRAVLCGDAIHHPLQVYEPQWCHNADEDKATATATRLALLQRCAAEGALLMPVHFGAPHVARIEREGAGFRPAFVEAHAA